MVLAEPKCWLVLTYVPCLPYLYFSASSATGNKYEYLLASSEIFWSSMS